MTIASPSRHDGGYWPWPPDGVDDERGGDETARTGRAGVARRPLDHREGAE